MKATQVANATPTIAWMGIIALIRGGILFHIVDFRVGICRMGMTHGAMVGMYGDGNHLCAHFTLRRDIIIKVLPLS